MDSADCSHTDQPVSMSSMTSPSLAEQNVQLQRRLDDEHAQYRRQLQGYHDEQQRQSMLVQKLHAEVTLITIFSRQNVN